MRLYQFEWKNLFKIEDKCFKTRKYHNEKNHKKISLRLRIYILHLSYISQKEIISITQLVILNPWCPFYW